MDNSQWMVYLMKFTNIMCMPTSMSIFATTATHLIGTVTDLKHMTRYSDYLPNDNLDLTNWWSCSKLMALLLTTLLGLKVLQASIYNKMEVILKVEPKIYECFWYGLWYLIQGYQLLVVMVDPYKLTYLGLLNLKNCVYL